MRRRGRRTRRSQPPGTRLRAWSSRWCSARTLERLVDPAIADLQMEYRDAIERGRRWRARWIRAAGYVRFVEILAVHGVERGFRSTVDWNADELRALTRTVVVASVTLAGATLLLLAPMRRSVPYSLVPYLVPQALPLAIPLAVTLGIMIGLGGRRILSRRLRAAALTIALACSSASFTTLAWIVPAAGQTFRVSMAEYLTGRQVHLSVGPAEMRLGELRARMVAYKYENRYALPYYLRWALPCAPLVLALLALTIRPRTAVHWWLPTLAAFGACIAYYLALVAGEAAGQRGLVSAAAARWLPNLLFLFLASCLTSRRIPVSPLEEPSSK